MGRGRGGYTEYQESYVDSKKKKVIDRGAIFVAERYMDLGYESVFRGQKEGKSLDLTIKTSDDTQFVKKHRGQNYRINKTLSDCKTTETCSRSNCRRRYGCFVFASSQQ